MALTMVRPTKHPKTGIYRIRKAIPEALRPAAKSLFGVSSELIVNLKTRSVSEARAATPRAIEELHVKFRALEAANKGGAAPLTDQAVEAFGGIYYRREYEKHADEPGPLSRWEDEQSYLEDHREWEEVDGRDGTGPRREDLPVALDEDRPAATALIVEAGYSPTPKNVERVASAIFAARYHLTVTMIRRVRHGYWGPDETVSSFPPLPAAAKGRALRAADAGPTMDVLLEGWARDGGLPLDAKHTSRAFYDRQQTMERLATFLGHRDAARVAKADAVRWKEEMQARGLSVRSIRNDISEMSAIWKYAIRNGKLAIGTNPFDGVSPPKPKSMKKERRSFTAEEATAILTAARSNKGFMRWLPWVCCLTGARISEICQAFKEDIAEFDGVTVLRIHDEGMDDEDGVRSIKNEDSRRSIPIHPALIAEGFLDYVKALPARSPLFPDAAPDAMFGRRGITAAKRISRWLKLGLKLTDPRISPNHSWRHWFTDACRRAGMNAEVRSALTGHSAKMDESAAYGAGMGSFTIVLANAMATVRPPMG